MTKAAWRILDPGEVPVGDGRLVMFACPHCGKEAKLPVLGVPLAQVGEGIVFDPGHRAIPKAIQCRFCRKRFQRGE